MGMGKGKEKERSWRASSASSSAPRMRGSRKTCGSTCTRKTRSSVSTSSSRRARACFHLYETGLPVRFYMPLTAVREGVLRESGTVTACPYKGLANYYDVVAPRVVGGGSGGGDEVEGCRVVLYESEDQVCSYCKLRVLL
ncbi:hypothetical protein F5B17DRAFT_409979 [Nemania serpens]|nr:hypothetical protein F5B17DRAFT_409979 [Nemania serpens]